MTTAETTVAEQSPVLSPEMVAQIEQWCGRYPDRRAVVLPALHLVHSALRQVPRAAVVEIASVLGLAPAEVQDTLTFYGFFKQDAAHGKVRVWVCRSISCALRGGDELIRQLCELVGTVPGETARDGSITIEAAECLGACEHAPCALANDELLRSLDGEDAASIYRRLRALADAVCESEGGCGSGKGSAP